MKKIISVILILTFMSCSKKEALPMRLSLPLKTVVTDPHRMEDIYSMMINLQIHSSLFQYLPDGSIVPDLAESYKVSQDNLTYTFTLANKNFSDNSKVEAKDIERSLKRLFLKGASISADLQSIEGYELFLRTKDVNALGINVIDNQKVEIKLSSPNPILIKQLATPDTGILKLDENYEIRNSVYSGKYKIKNQNGSELVLTLWSQNQFTSKNPARDIFFHLNEHDQSYNLALKNNVDLVKISLLESDKINELKSLNYKEVVSGITHEQFLVLNSEKVSLDWRKYLFSKFDTDELIKDLGFNHLEPAYGFVPSVLKGSIKSSLKNEIDLKYDEGKLSPLLLNINFMTGKMEEKIATFLKSKWNHPKLKININYLPVDKYLEDIFSKNFDSSVISKGLDYPDAMANLSYFKSDIKDNFFLVFDKEIDKKIKYCSLYSDKEGECFIDLQKSILKKTSVIPLYFGNDKVEFWSSRVKSIPSHPLGLQFLKLDQVEMNNE